MDEERQRFEQWYATHALNHERDPIGSRDCGLQWAAWQAGSESHRAELAAVRRVLNHAVAMAMDCDPELPHYLPRPSRGTHRRSPQGRGDRVMDFDGMTFNRVTDHPECWVSDHLCRGTTALEDAMLSEIERLRAELAECKEDAERYRWLRNRIPGSAYRIAGIIYSEGGAGVDAGIDAARKGEGEE